MGIAGGWFGVQNRCWVLSKAAVQRLFPLFESRCLFMAGNPRQPRGFGAAGARFWKETIATFDFSEESGKLLILEHACKVTDVIAQLEKAASSAPLTCLGSARQTQIHPLISEIRFQRGLLAQLVTKLGLPETEEAAQERAENLTRVRRKAARLRLAL